MYIYTSCALAVSYDKRNIKRPPLDNTVTSRTIVNGYSPFNHRTLRVGDEVENKKVEGFIVRRYDAARV